MRAEPCWAQHWHTEFGEPMSFSVPLSHCLPFSDRKTIEGVWIFGHEGSDFYPGARSADVQHSWPITRGVELYIDRLAADVISQSAGLDPQAPVDQALFLRFVGRHSLTAPPHAGNNPGDRAVVIDRLISATPVADTPAASTRSGR
jgi:hypothetical protein